MTIVYDAVKAAPSERVPLPRDDWYIGTASVALGREPLAIRIFDQPIVLFRKDDGAPAALHDRCPHRGVALSLGANCDSAIACAYHGWRFGADGGCVHIPSLAQGRDIPRGVGVPAYPCVERDGYVWVWPDAGASAPAAPRVIAGFADHVWLQGRTVLACEAVLPIENNLDWCHPYFTHPGSHGLYFEIQARGFRDVVCELETTPTGLVMSCRSSPGARLTFDLPDRVTVEGGQGARRQHIVIHHVPTGPASCRQEWLYALRPAGPGDPHAVNWTDEPSKIFEQDRRVLESAQATYEREGDRFERSVEADAATLLVRRIIAAAGDGRWSAGAGPELHREVHLRS